MLKSCLKLGLMLCVLLTLIACSQQAAELLKTHCKDLTQGCDIGVGLISFNQTPKPLTPFVVTFKSTKLDAPVKRVKAQFKMQNMQMGFNEYRFIQIKPDVWQANVVLPVCMQGGADWLLMLEIHHANNVKKLKIPFKSD